jgi:hypothetical protein
MKRSVAAIIAVFALSASGVWAQGTAKTESFIGIVKTVSSSSLTVERGTITAVFTVDPKTHVSAKGSTAKTKEAQAAGKPGLTVPDAIHVGDQVQVKFHEQNKAMIATDIVLVTRLAAK